MMLDASKLDYTALNNAIRDSSEPCRVENCSCFDLEAEGLLGAPFTVVTPDSANPYKQMYAAN